MIVAGAEAAQQHAPLIRFAIAVGVFEKQQFGAVADVGASVSEFEAGGNHQAVSKHGGLVAAPVAVGVFEDEQFVVRHLSRLNLWINRASNDPQASARIEANLNR